MRSSNASLGQPRSKWTEEETAWLLAVGKAAGFRPGWTDLATNCPQLGAQCDGRLSYMKKKYSGLYEQRTMSDDDVTNKFVKDMQRVSPNYRLPALDEDTQKFIEEDFFLIDGDGTKIQIKLQ